MSEEKKSEKLTAKYRFDGEDKCRLDKLPTDSKSDGVDKEEILKRYEENLERMGELQEKLYADGKEGVIIVLQAIDAAGKDSTIKHVMRGFNPQGVTVYSFKAPNSEELAHDYLWRINKCLPRRGEIAIWNRSHYEDVLAVDIHDIWQNYSYAERVLDEDKKEFFKKRYRQIKNYEEYLYENSYRVVKLFLHISKDEQKARFLERIDRPEKNWKFAASDLDDRALWDDYIELFDKVISNTASKHAPWYAIPADQKWYARFLVSEILVELLEQCDPKFPEVTDEGRAELADCRERLENE